MQVFVARQPILNRRKGVVAYELLYRDGPQNCFPMGMDGASATSRLISQTHLNAGIFSYTRGRSALINFTYEAIIEGVPKLLPVNEVVIEVLETAKPDDELYKACKELFTMGYKLALDDFVYEEQWLRFLPLLKMVKFDITQTPLQELREVKPFIESHPVQNVRNIKILAERVETEEQFNQALDMGFDFFQGYFFAKPKMLANSDTKPHQAALLAIYAEVMRDHYNVARLDKLFKQDPGLTYKLLSYLKTGTFRTAAEITSIKTAILYLGETQMRRFVALLVTANLDSTKPGELVFNSIMRARFCELLASRVNKALQEQAFFVGLLSLLDAILDRPLAKILTQISVAVPIKEALIMGEESGISDESQQLNFILECVKAHETGSWRGLQRAVAKLRIDEAVIPPMHQQAISWTSEFLQQSKG